MRKHSLLCGGLFIVECVRLSFLSEGLGILMSSAEGAFPWHIFAVPNALFVLMALFLWLDVTKYGVYLPLYISGKLLSLFCEIAGGIIFFGKVIFLGPEISNSLRILAVIIFIDLISLVPALIARIKNIKNKPVSSVVSSGPSIGVMAHNEETGEYGGK